MSIENNSSNGGIQISISNETATAISNTVLEWRKVQSFDLAKVLETMERVGDKCIGVIVAIETARQERIARYDAAARGEVHVHTTEKAVKV